MEVNGNILKWLGYNPMFRVGNNADTEFISLEYHTSSGNIGSMRYNGNDALVFTPYGIRQYMAFISSQTITHYAPIEGNITDFVVGIPVFMSGKVYNLNPDIFDKIEWIPSTINDRQDCICSVITTGNHKTYVGVIVEVDGKNNSVKFASHGDFMFNVEDSSLYEIGDVILYDGRILEDDLMLSSALLQSVVGKITSIIDEHTISVFKD